MALEADYNTMDVLNESQYECIDKEIHTSVMDAANLLLKVPKAWWMLETGHKFCSLQFWQAKLSFQQNRMDRTKELEQL
eukprot:7035611-Ditylum_brightwellii.AAC.1